MTRNLIYIERIANNDTFIVSISRNQISAMCICCYQLSPFHSSMIAPRDPGYT